MPSSKILSPIYAFFLLLTLHSIANLLQIYCKFCGLNTDKSASFLIYSSYNLHWKEFLSKQSVICHFFDQNPAWERLLGMTDGV